MYSKQDFYTQFNRKQIPGRNVKLSCDKNVSSGEERWNCKYCHNAAYQLFFFFKCVPVTIFRPVLALVNSTVHAFLSRNSNHARQR